MNLDARSMRGTARDRRMGIVHMQRAGKANQRRLATSVGSSANAGVKATPPDDSRVAN